MDPFGVDLGSIWVGLGSSCRNRGVAKPLPDLGRMKLPAGAAFQSRRTLEARRSPAVGRQKKLLFPVGISPENLFLSRSLHFRRLSNFSFRFRAKIDSVYQMVNRIGKQEIRGRSRLAVEDERAQVGGAGSRRSVCSGPAPSRLRLWAPANASNCSRRCDRRVLSLNERSSPRLSVDPHTLWHGEAHSGLLAAALRRPTALHPPLARPSHRPTPATGATAR